LLGTATADVTTGAWSLTPTSALTDGTHSLTATSTDAAGNTSAATSVCTLIVGTVPTITASPVNKAVFVGSPVSFAATATGTGPLNYEWQWSADGTTFTTITGATSASYALTSATLANAGYYRVTVTNPFGTVVSASARLTASPVVAASVPVPDGYASATTGGGTAAPVVVFNAADFKTQATSTSACTITVVGQLNIGTVNVTSNKTIQGADASAALLGNLTLGSGVSNVIIRGLHLTNPGNTIVSGAYTDGGDALTVSGASKVFVTHCTFFDCADHDMKIVSGADNVTVSWCEFYNSAATLLHCCSVQIGTDSENQALHVTLHHNWWSANVDQRMPFSSYGYVHQYNNYLASAGNTSGSVASDRSQFLSERNDYAGMVGPLSKQNVTASLAAGKIRVIGNLYTNCTGAAPDTGADTVFTPDYSYEMMPASDVAVEVAARAGNIAGAATTDPVTGTASVTAPPAILRPGTSFTLTAASSGFTASSYQWRLNNADIAGATASTYTVSNLQTAKTGTYTVAISMTSGDTVVSMPVIVSMSTQPTNPGSGSSSGGGSVGGWFYAALALLGWARFRSGRR